MKFSTVVVSSVLFFASAFARPSRLAERIAAREARKSGVASFNVESERNSTHATSTNWSGVVIENPPSGSTFNSVVGTFTVPTPSGTGAASAWVGIDGDTAQNSILQSGVDFTVSGGRVSYDTWYEWYVNFAIDISGFTVSAGNQIRITVTSTSSTRGTVLLENLTTGRSVTQAVSAPSSSAALQGRNAEWIVEDFEENGALVPLTNWGTVTFSSATARTNTGTSVAPSTGTIINMEQNGQVLTSVSTSGSSVTVRHT
ncbi:hypothetical protein GYMLUDRAFT_262764 [Collybiopsis luxurians FD-317 M1]|uniref:Aspergillopepsin n=1 Tax=Collybiopsis luxurians FD-317 M1 TaxID=944289 RepID=A0A0D0C5V7_9AGAR|nr:hypothetical protein GYMLUDRAFT_262764 [Collybiopsis luxurians FD-317 M1]